jgi:hypothetical protein
MCTSSQRIVVVYSSQRVTAARGVNGALVGMIRDSGGCDCSATSVQRLSGCLLDGSESSWRARTIECGGKVLPRRCPFACEL